MPSKERGGKEGCPDSYFFVDKGNPFLYYKIVGNEKGKIASATEEPKGNLSKFFLNFSLDNLQNQLDNKNLRNDLVL